eukprot:COSAG05_NODE_13315_length_434_cov_1.080597_1_plen_35_part_01
MADEKCCAVYAVWVVVAHLSIYLSIYLSISGQDLG